MKKLFLMITLCFQVSYANNFFDQFYHLDNNANTVGLEKKLLDAKKLAVVWIKDYYLFRKPHLAEDSLEKLILEKMASTLEDAFFFLPKRGVRISADFCPDKSTQFASNKSISEEGESFLFIFKCNKLDFSLGEFTQIFVHEANHTAMFSINDDNDRGLSRYRIKSDFESSEILATEYEIKVTDHVNKCIFTKNSNLKEESNTLVPILNIIGGMLPKLCE